MIVDTPALNAFATGLRSDDGAIVVTSGLLAALDREELQGVVAHEMGHIRNLDTLYLTAIALFAGLIALVADVGVRALRIGRGVGRSSDRKGGGALAVVGVALALLLAIVAPLVANLVRLAVSREREYLADATAVRFTRNPQGLISALGKIAGGTFPLPGANRAMQHMYIVNPLEPFDPDPGALWSTHPPTEDRIARLRNLAA
jgi:heat shock protein HtpX